jgi:hypothetical protein
VRRFFVLVCLICSVTAKAQTCTRTNGRIHWRASTISSRDSLLKWRPRSRSCRFQFGRLPIWRSHLDDPRFCKSSANAISSPCRWNPIEPAFAKAGINRRFQNSLGIITYCDARQRRDS